MEKSGLTKLIEIFFDMPDPRGVGRTDHRLLDILYAALHENTWQRFLDMSIGHLMRLH